MSAAAAIALEAAALTLEREAAELRRQAAALRDTPVQRQRLASAPSAPSTHDLIDVAIAAQRFGYPADTIRSWLRTDPDLGEKRGGRWFVSASRMRIFAGARR